MADGLKKRKIMIMGARSVGKSSLFYRFINNNFDPNYFPTIQNSKKMAVKFNGVEYECEIVDTAGKDEYSILDENLLMGYHGFILVYSIASIASFNLVKNLYEKIVTTCGTEKIPCVVVGTKSDLGVEPSSSRQVNEEGGKFAKDMCAAWVETSSKDNVNIDKVFELCLAEIDKSTPGADPAAEKGKCRIM